MSASACTAVGTYIDKAGDLVTLAERWDGTSWAVQTTPNPPGATGISLSGVSCASARACTAVGAYEDSAGDGLSFAERWTGGAGRSRPPPTLKAASWMGCRACR